MALRSGFIIVYNRIPALIAAVEANTRAAVKRKAEDIAKDARARAPVRTGFLRDSIEAESITAGKEAIVTVGAEYGAYVEFGTYKMAAQPFLYPAVMAHADDFFEAVGPGAFKL